MTWKRDTAVLPESARGSGRYRGKDYPFCLPAEFASLNLLPDAVVAMDRFERAQVPWHVGVAGGPTNHLCSSQIQCVNALAPFVARPDALQQIFGTSLSILELQPFGDPIAPGDFVAFEWIGEGNPLGEWTGSVGTRGAQATSADAAIRYIALDGKTEVALIEWKYVEQYLGHEELKGGAKSKATRDERYRHLFDAPDGPLHTDLIPYDDLYVDPVYQLLRLQLLARQFEKACVADRVRLLLCAPHANTDYWRSLNRASHRTAGGQDIRDVGSLWLAMQRIPDRFVLFDTRQLVTEDSPLSTEFKSRYGHLADPPPPGSPSPFGSDANS